MTYWEIIKSWLKQGVSTSFKIFKIMIPVTILVKILNETGLIVYVGKALSPLMGVMGLPGEMGLVWASAMVGNIYAGLVAYFSIDSALSTAQITVLATIILIAHTLPVELGIAHKAGAKLISTFLFRFLLGLISGIILFHCYNVFNLYQEIPTEISKAGIISEKATWLSWILSELINYGLIFCMITGLIILIDILKRLHIIEKINSMFYPILKLLGIGKEVIPITVIGMTLGLAYGGGLIINEVKQNQLPRRDVLYALMLMSLCHSIIEDSLLMISIGASYTGVFLFRVIFTLIIMYIFVRITKKWSEEKMKKWFYSKQN